MSGTASAPALSEGGNPGNGTVTYRYKPRDAEDSQYDTAVPTAAGEYTVRATIAATENYNGGMAKAADFIISQRPVTVSGITAADKVYDGTLTATLDTGNAVFAGKLDNDELTVTATGTFTDANAGENQTVAVSDLILSGTSAGNYALADGQQSSAVGRITVSIPMADSSGSATVREHFPKQEISCIVSILFMFLSLLIHIPGNYVPRHW